MTLTSKIINDTESFETFRSLLSSAKLPVEDLNFTDHLLIGYYQDNLPVGTGGLEIYGDYALLRSLSVQFGVRGKSLGSTITDQLIMHAQNHKLKAIYLLTETAHAFFLKKGFVDVARSAVPNEIKSSSEFSRVCSDTAVCMMYTL